MEDETPLLVRLLHLLKPFFPLCPGKAAPMSYLFAGPFLLQTYGIYTTYIRLLISVYIT